MFPDEINLPIGIEFFEPNISSYTELNFEEIVSNLMTGELITKIQTQETLLVINDAHRSTPSFKILNALLKIAPDHQIKAIAIATGTHEGPTGKELYNLFRNKKRLSQFDIIIHDSSSETINFLGVTSRGTEVKVNPIIFKYENVVTINSVEPHYFAGFTGGVKSIIPGLAATSTVEQNHAWAIHELSGPTKINQNPVQLDLQEAITLIKKKFYGIQLVNDQEKIFHISHGELIKAFHDAVSVSLQIYCTKVTQLYDVIVSIVNPPINRSLYQAQKGIENTRQALVRGGTLILMANCPEGIGNDLFFNTLSNFDKPEEVLTQITIENYSFGNHKVVKFASIALQADLRIIGNVTPKECKNVFASSMSINDLEEFLTNQSKMGKKIAIVIDSGLLVLH